jgi:hypothetical protein
MRYMSKSLLLLGVLLLLGSESKSQQASLPKATLDPCPGRVYDVDMEILGVDSLEGLIYTADLIVVGTVTNVQAAVLSIPDRPIMTETHSEVSVTQRLFGALPNGVSSILIAQRGGTFGPCTALVRADPLVKFGEEYVLFLTLDSRTSPSSAVKLPRYLPVGFWNGKAKIVDGRVEFLPEATNLLKHHKTDVNEFLSLVQRRIKAIYPNGVKLPTTKKLPVITVTRPPVNITRP